MSLSIDEIKKVALLARIAVSDAEIESFLRSLNNIIAQAEQMQDIDTTELRPFVNPLDIHQRLRPDEVMQHNQRETYQRVAPHVEAGLYLVPQIIDEV